MNAIVRFFRQRAINEFLIKKKTCSLPDITNYPSVAVLLDQKQFKQHKDLENTLKRLFVPKKYTFIVYVDEYPKDVMQTDRYFFIRKEDFNFRGLMKEGKKESLKNLTFDLMIDFTGKSDDELLTNAYILTLTDDSFRLTFGNAFTSLYDMVIDSKNDNDILNQMEIVKDYLSMLIGKR